VCVGVFLGIGFRIGAFAASGDPSHQNEMPHVIPLLYIWTILPSSID
jgi:hypothetical protein